MKAKCPYCGGPINGEAALPPMSSRMLRVYRTIAAAGHKGIMPIDLIPRMYDEDEWPTPGGGVVLRVQICGINKLIAPLNQRIVGKRSTGYRLIRYRETTHEEEKLGGH